MTFFVLVACGAVVLAPIVGTVVALHGRVPDRRDACLVLAGVGALCLPAVHAALQFVGFVADPRHIPGARSRWWADARLEALLIAVVSAALVVVCAIVGASTRPRVPWRCVIAGVQTTVAAVFLAVELSADLPVVAVAWSGLRAGVA